MFNRLPRFVYLNNEKYFIKTDFRIFIDFEREMQGKEKEKAIEKCLSRFYPAFFQILSQNLLEEAVDEFIKFYKCNKEDKETTKKGGKTERLFDYDIDSDLIWGAFYTQYRVDLTTANIHWWKFKAMWNSLDKECEFSKIRSYRAYNGKDKELLELKEFYKLPPTESEEDDIKRRQEIFNQLNKYKER